MSVTSLTICRTPALLWSLLVYSWMCPGVLCQTQSTVRWPLSLPLLSIFSFRKTCPRPFCAPEPLPASSWREHGVSLPPFSEDPLESLHMLSGRQPASIKAQKNYSVFHIWKMKRNCANNSTCNKIPLPVTLLISRVEGTHTAFKLPSCEAL